MKFENLGIYGSLGERNYRKKKNKSVHLKVRQTFSTPTENILYLGKKMKVTGFLSRAHNYGKYLKAQKLNNERDVKGRHKA